MAVLNVNFVFKVLLAFLFLFIFRVGVYLPSPAVNTEYFLSKLTTFNSGLFSGTISTISSSVFGSFSILSLGVMPYILSSIMTQIISYIYQDDKSKNSKDSAFYAKISRVFTIVFALIQSIILFFTMKNFCDVFYCNALSKQMIYFISSISVVAGSMISLWIGEVITEYCLGNGISMIIFTNIGFDFVSGLIKVFSSEGGGLSNMFLALSLILGVICIIVLCEKSARLVEVQYSSHNSKNSDGSLSFIPMKLNFAGVMPMIFTVTIIGFFMSSLNLLIGMFGGIFDEFVLFALRSKVFYYCIYFVFILLFALIYNNVSFNVEKVSDSLRKTSGVVPGIKPGALTIKYFSTLLGKLTVIGVFYLFLVSVLVDYFKIILGVDSFIGGTSYLIITVIALELINKYQVEILNSRYSEYNF